jgi:hypothetical protein
MVQAVMAIFTHKFWMGFNSFVLLFLAVNAGTIGVEIDSGVPFIIALAYMVYMSVYLSKGGIWKVFILLGIGIVGALFYIIGIAFRLTPSSLMALAQTHIVLSLILAAGTLAHLRSKK